MRLGTLILLAIAATIAGCSTELVRTKVALVSALSSSFDEMSNTGTETEALARFCLDAKRVFGLPIVPSRVVIDRVAAAAGPSDTAALLRSSLAASCAYESLCLPPDARRLRCPKSSTVP